MCHCACRLQNLTFYKAVGNQGQKSALKSLVNIVIDKPKIM